MTEQERKQAFADEYNELCKKHGMKLVAAPALVPRDDGTYSVVVRWSVAIQAQQVIPQAQKAQTLTE